MLRWQRIDITLVNHLLSYEFKEVHGKNCYSHPTTTAYVIQFKRISLESSREMGNGYVVHSNVQPMLHKKAIHLLEKSTARLRLCKAQVFQH